MFVSAQVLVVEGSPTQAIQVGELLEQKGMYACDYVQGFLYTAR